MADWDIAQARLERRIAEGQASVSDFLLTDAAQPVPHADAVAQIEQAVTMVRRQYRDDPVVRGDLLADAANRLRWIGEAFAVFRVAPVRQLALNLAFLLMLALALSVPAAGFALVWILIPALVVGPHAIARAAASGT